MMIKEFTNSWLGQKTYVVRDKTSCVVIDPGNTVYRYLQYLQDNNLIPTAVLLTHGHFDHIWGLNDLLAIWPQMPVYISQKDAHFLTTDDNEALRFAKKSWRITSSATVKLLPASKLQIESLQFQIEVTPGHTPGSVSYFLSGEPAVFTGDTVFSDGVGITSFAYSSYRTLCLSCVRLNGLIKAHDWIYPGHGKIGQWSKVKNQNTEFQTCLAKKDSNFQ